MVCTRAQVGTVAASANLQALEDSDVRRVHAEQAPLPLQREPVLDDAGPRLAGI